MYLDVNVNDIGENHTVKKDPTADIKQFFSDPFSMDGHGKKKRRHCNICKYVFSNFLLLLSLICSRKRKVYSQSGLGDDCTSLRRHLQAYHRVSHFCRSSHSLTKAYVDGLREVGKVNRLCVDAP